jgi:hypothetical protein
MPATLPLKSEIIVEKSPIEILELSTFEIQGSPLNFT